MSSNLKMIRSTVWNDGNEYEWWDGKEWVESRLDALVMSEEDATEVVTRIRQELQVEPIGNRFAVGLIPFRD